MAKKTAKKPAAKKAPAKKKAPVKKVEAKVAPVIQEAEGLPTPPPLAEEVVELPKAVAPVKKEKPAVKKAASPKRHKFIF